MGVLTSGFYVVPRFQRPYSWDKENVYDFWADVVVSVDGADYFIGSMVVFKAKDGTCGIVDGQQRLTTITMALAAVRNSFLSEGLTDLAVGIQNLIEKRDVDNKARFTISTETSFPYFQEHIQKLGQADLNYEPGNEEKRLQGAFQVLTEFVEEKIYEIKRNPQLDDARKAAAIIKELSSIRDKLLSLKLIYIEVDDENDAYNIFETLNTRGKDLTVSDLVKNHLTRIIKPTNKNVDTAKIKWERIRDVVEGSSADLKIDTFLHHYWLSKEEFLTTKKLFKSLRKRVTQENAKQFLDDLYEDSISYRQIHETSYKKQWSPQESKIRSALEALSLFGVTQQTPMVLAVMRAYNAKKLKPKYTSRILSAIENFHFAFTQVTSQRSSGGISSMYSSAARRFTAAGDEGERIELLKEFIHKLIERVPSESEFVVNFEQILFSDKYAKNRRAVRYILSKFFEADTKSHVADFSLMTVEHVLPQSAEDELSSNDENAIAQIGNLILIPQSLNSKLGEKDFIKKRSLLQKAGVTLDKWLLQAGTWGPEQIKQRTSALASLAYRNIWKIEQI